MSEKSTRKANHRTEGLDLQGTDRNFQDADSRDADLTTVSDSALTGCPDESVLVTVLSGASEVEGWLTRHLSGCTECQQRLDGLSDTSPLCEYRNQLSANEFAACFFDPPIREGDLGSLDGLAIEAQIGSGGMGFVYRGRDERLGRLVAVKILRQFDQPRAASRFQREVRAAGRLEHDHVVPIFSTGYARDGRPYLVMPLVEGESLRERLAERPLDPRDAARIIREVALGLEAAHALGLIHRDVKPANIMLDRQTGRARLTDFGLARSEGDGTLTQADVVCGTPEYMAPEQVADPESTDPRGDLYSLGVTLYECLTGSPPFRGRPLEVLEQHRRHEPVPPSRLNRLIPRALETVCLKAMAREPDRRYSSATALANDLLCFIEGRPISARPVSQLSRMRLWRRRQPGLAAAIVALTLSLVAGTTVSTTLWLKSERKANEARKLASSLADSRERTRESVRQFQRRVLEAESLRWNMDTKLQSQLFADVINYLDEFAALEADSTDRESEMREGVDGLAVDYLQVAEAAIRSGRMNEVRLAAGRGLARLKAATSGPGRNEVKNWSMLNRAAKLLIRADNPLQQPDQPSQTYSSVADWQMVAFESAARACELAPNDPAVKLCSLETRLLQWSRDRIREPSRTELESLYAELLELEIAWEQKVPALLKAVWRLARLVEDPEIWLNKNSSAINKLREELRGTQRHVMDTDRMRGHNEWHRSFIAKQSGDPQAAITAMNAALECLVEVSRRQPQNRRLRRELAEAWAAMAELNVATGQLAVADRALDRTLKEYIDIIELDSADLPARVRLIGHFIRYGLLSKEMNQPEWVRKSLLTAAEDCKLLLSYEDIAAHWAIRTRVWVLKQVDTLAGDTTPARMEESSITLKRWLTQLENGNSKYTSFARECAVAEASPAPPIPPDLDGLGNMPIDPLRFSID